VLVYLIHMDMLWHVVASFQHSRGTSAGRWGILGCVLAGVTGDHLPLQKRVVALSFSHFWCMQGDDGCNGQSWGRLRVLTT